MCGIFGIVHHQPSVAADDERLLEAMGGTQVHRGPDDAGTFCGKGVALGMRRLSIIDLSGGHQPMTNEDQTVWVVCNGEIYNFQELRSTLQAKGHRFRSSSDTEVIVHLYEEEGLELFRHLRGMFAIALWDSRIQRLLLARDRLGKKPLYVYRDATRLLFSSEMKSILQAPNVPRRLDYAALQEYLAIGYVPGPITLLSGVEKVLPGHFMTVEDGRVEQREYWNISPDRIEKWSEEEWIEQVRAKLLESVKIRMVSDVPLGAFLSGGIDSSAIVAAMARTSGQPVKTYSIGFDGEGKFYNELPYARLIASAHKTDHHEIIVRPNVAHLLPKLIWHLDEPIADSAFLTTYLVSELAQQSVKVILSGVGGDELFGGYRRYLGGEVSRFYQWLPGWTRSTLRAVLARLPHDRTSGLANLVRYADAFSKTAELDPLIRYLTYVTLFTPDVREQLTAPSLWSASHGTSFSKSLEKCFGRVTACDALSQMMYVDIKTSLADDLLLLTDKMTMAASIECRAPFMDHELVELASRMPSSYKVRGLTLKYLLKKAVAPWLPQEVIYRKKRGFGAPMGTWLRSSLDGLVQETLSTHQVAKRGLFNPQHISQIILQHRERKADHTDHLLALINLELWCRIFLDGNGRSWS